MCISVCGYRHMSAGIQGGQRHQFTWRKSYPSNVGAGNQICVPCKSSGLNGEDLSLVLSIQFSNDKATFQKIHYFLSL